VVKECLPVQEKTLKTDVIFPKWHHMGAQYVFKIIMEFVSAHVKLLKIRNLRALFASKDTVRRLNC